MKKNIIVLAALLLCAGVLTGCGSHGFGGGKDLDIVSSSDIVSSDVQLTPHKFDRSDLTVNGKISLGMTPDEVKAVMGAPESEETFTNDNFIYGAYTTATYGGLTLTFFDVTGGENFTLGTIYSESEADIFARGLHIGSTADEVLAAFTRDEQSQPLYFSGMEEKYGDYIYGNYNREDLIELKPKGALEFAYMTKWQTEDDVYTQYTMEYYYGDPLNWNEDETAYSGNLYSLVFYVDVETNLVKNIMLSYDFIE